MLSTGCLGLVLVLRLSVLVSVLVMRVSVLVLLTWCLVNITEGLLPSTIPSKTATDLVSQLSSILQM